jgi:hypothetical protein
MEGEQGMNEEEMNRRGRRERERLAREERGGRKLSYQG